MLFRQITHDDLGCASYLIGDEAEGVADEKAWIAAFEWRDPQIDRAIFFQRLRTLEDDPLSIR